MLIHTMGISTSERRKGQRTVIEKFRYKKFINLKINNSLNTYGKFRTNILHQKFY